MPYPRLPMLPGARPGPMAGPGPTIPPPPGGPRPMPMGPPPRPPAAPPGMPMPMGAAPFQPPMAPSPMGTPEDPTGAGERAQLTRDALIEMLRQKAPEPAGSATPAPFVPPTATGSGRRMR